MNSSSDNDLVLCALYSDLPTASIALGALRSAGIDSIIDNATMGTVLPPAGAIRLMVRQSDLETARAILDEAHMLD